VKNLAPLPVLPDRYRPLAVLGEGATGTVYRADDRVLGVDVAVKVVRPNLAMHARFRARFAREVALSSQVVHPRLVPVHDTGRLPDGRPFVALAYADGGSLSNLMRREPGLSEGLRLIDQVLDALAALHARGVLHQDLKPANVLLRTSHPGQVDAWVADLGVAAALSELAMNKRSISGTPTWMAPEQLTGAHHELGPWTDLYAVGLILLALLAGMPGGDAADRKAMLDRRLERPPDMPENAPPKVAEVIRNLLDPDPRQRYDRAADVRRALRLASAGLADQPLLGALGEGGDTADTVGPGNTSFDQSILPEAQEAIVVSRRSTPVAGSAPRWNQVQPERMPLRPPASRGLGASSRTSLGLFALRDPPMVAREPLRRLLWQKARETIQSARPQVVLVVGATGSGKSRVVESVVDGLEEGGFMEAFWLRYHRPAGGDDGYRGAVREILAPWNDTRPRVEARLQRWLARDQQVAPAAVANEASVLARWCGYVQTGEEPVNAAVGLAFLYRHIDARAWRGGTCLVLEDVHNCRAEGDGLAICDAILSESVGRRPVVVFATVSAQAIEEDPLLARQISSLIARGALQVNCSRLSVAQMEQLLIMSLNLAPALAAEIAPACEGSPSFAMLLLRDWAARGLLTRNSDMHFVLRDDLRPALVLAPDYITLCERRMSGALACCEDPDAAGAALAATALAGQVPPVSLIQDVHPEGLDALLATGLLSQRGWRLAFEHPSMRDLALTAAQKRPDLHILHRQLADAWEALGKRTGVEVNRPLGEHRLLAAMPTAALGPLLQASRGALVEGRLSLSLESARFAIEAADRVGALPGRVQARRQVVEALLDLDRAAEAGRVLGETWKLGHIDRATTAHLRVQEARVAMESGDLLRARRLLENAALAFQATRDWVGQVDAAHCQGVLARLEARPDEAADHYAQMLRLNRSDLRREAVALFGLVESSIAAGRLKGIDRTVERLRMVARESGDTRNIAQATFAGGLLHLRRRNLQDAERYFLTARALAATLGADNLLLACLSHLAEISRYRGDDADAEETLRVAARLATERGWLVHAATSRIQLGLLALVRRADRLAHIEIARAEKNLAAHPHHLGWISISVVRALWFAEDGDAEACRQSWSRARKLGLGRMATPDLWIPLERLAAVATGRGWSDLSAEALGFSRGSGGEGASDAVEAVEVEDVEDLESVGSVELSPARPGDDEPSVIEALDDEELSSSSLVSVLPFSTDPDDLPTMAQRRHPLPIPRKKPAVEDEVTLRQARSDDLPPPPRRRDGSS